MCATYFLILYSYKFLVAKHFKFKHTHFLSSSLEINMKVATIFLLSLIGLSAVKASPPSLEDQLSYQKKHPLLTCVPGVTATTLCTDACPKEKAYVQCLGHLCQGYEMNGDPFLQSDFLEQCNRVQTALNTACPTVPCDLQCSSVGNGCNIEQPDADLDAIYMYDALTFFSLALTLCVACVFRALLSRYTTTRDLTHLVKLKIILLCAALFKAALGCWMLLILSTISNSVTAFYPYIVFLIAVLWTLRYRRVQAMIARHNAANANLGDAEVGQPRQGDYVPPIAVQVAEDVDVDVEKGDN